MKKTSLVAVGISGVFLFALGGWGLGRYYTQQQLKTRLSQAEDALNHSEPYRALQLLPKTSAGTPEFLQAQDIETKALLSLSDDVERKADEIESVIDQAAQVKIMEDRQRAELAKASPGSQRYIQIERKLSELEAIEQKLFQSNQFTAAGFGQMTDEGRNRMLVLMYEETVGHPIDDRTKSLVDAITIQRSLERGAARRRKSAASSQAKVISEGGTTTYSTAGEFDRILVMQDYKLADSETLERVSLVFGQDHSLCSEGFEAVELKVPGVSSPKLTVHVNCGPSIK